MASVAITNVIDPPPRLTGDSGRDTVAVIQWLSAFYAKGVLSGGLLQPQNLAPGLISLGALASEADKIPYYTGEDTFDLTAFTAFARSILDDEDAAAVRTTIGAGTVTSVTGTAPIASSGGDAPVISIDDFAASGVAHARGAVPDPGAAAGTVKYLREDATWATPPGAGNVVGPAGATGNNVAVFDGATGLIIKDGGTLGTAAFTAATAYDVAGAAAAVTPTTLGLVIGTDTQAHDAQLDSIAALADAAGWLHNDGAGAFAYSTPTATNVGLGNVTNDAQTKASIVPNTAPSAGQVLAGNAGGTAYAPVTVSGDGTLSSAGALAVTKSGGVAFGSAAFTASTAYAAAPTTGTFSPKLYLGATEITSYLKQRGQYAIIAGMCIFSLFIRINAVGAGTGNVTITNLPATRLATESLDQTALSVYFTGFGGLGLTTESIQARILQNTSVVDLFLYTAGDVVALAHTQVQASGQIGISGAYPV